MTIDQTQQSLDKKKSPPLKSGRTTRVSKASRLRQLPSSPPARAAALGSLGAARETEHPKREKNTPSCCLAGEAEMERLTSGWFR